MFISVDPNRNQGWTKAGENGDVIRYNCGKRIVGMVGVLDIVESSKLCPNHP